MALILKLKFTHQNPSNPNKLTDDFLCPLDKLLVLYRFERLGFLVESILLENFTIHIVNESNELRGDIAYSFLGDITRLAYEFNLYVSLVSEEGE